MSKVRMLFILSILLLFSCNTESNKYELFFDEELQVASKGRVNNYYYFINTQSCSGCLEINNYFLLDNKLDRLNLIFVGNMEDRGFFKRSDYSSDIWNITEITEQKIFRYDIYTNDPLLVRFDKNGDLDYAKNIKVEEIDQLMIL